MSGRHAGTLTAAAIAVALALSACGTSRADSAGAGRGARPEQPMSGGQVVFDRRCAACHTTTYAARVGPGLDGLFQRARLPNGQPVAEAEVRLCIVRGGGRLPPQHLSPGDLDTLFPYLKTLE